MSLSQTQRRKKVTSLHHLAILKLSSNHHLLRDIDNLSIYYHLIKPILFKLTKQQLFNLELRDEKLIPLTEEIWNGLLLKRFPQLTEEPGISSRDRYLQLESELQLKRESLVRKLRLHTKELEKQKSIDQIEVIDHIQTPSKDPKLHFKSSILQKINKECSIREKKFNHNIRFNNLNSKRVMKRKMSEDDIPRKVKIPKQESKPESKSISKSEQKPTPKTIPNSIFIPRSKPTILAPSTVPKKRKIKSQRQQRPLLQSKTLKKSSIFIALAGGVKGQ